MFLVIQFEPKIILCIFNFIHIAPFNSYRSLIQLKYNL